MATPPKTQFARIDRLPPYVFSITSELKMAARRRGEDIIDFGMGNPDGATPAHIVNKLVETVQRGDTHGYSVSKGIPRLRRAICHWYDRRYGVSFDPETEAIVTIGSKEGIAHLALAKEHGIWIAHDLAYADICFDDFRAPSIMQVEGARDVAVEFFTMSKSYNMAGWRIGFMVGNRDLVYALSRIKGYHDYGTFTPIQVAAIAALEGPQDCVVDIAQRYQRRRDVLVKGLHEAGWMVDVPKASMYVWAKIPDAYADLGSLEFAKRLLKQAKVSVSPGIGFGEYGDTHVRFAMIENEARTRQAIRGIKQMFREDGLR